jgi:CDP-diacylglycerol--serine O-phosphatidyltransferase
MTTPRRHLSMLRSYTAADALTIGNAACGTIAIFLCLEYISAAERRFLWIAFLLLPLALVLDFFDGYVARLNRARQSVLGSDLDSLADVISFGVAPAVLGRWPNRTGCPRCRSTRARCASRTARRVRVRCWC